MHTEFEYLSTRPYTRQSLIGLLSSQKALATQVGVHPAGPLPSEVTLADVLDARGRIEATRGKVGAARILHEQAMELRRSHHGEADPYLLRSFSWIGWLLLRDGRVEQAEWLFQQAYQVASRRFGPTRLPTSAALHNLAIVARRSGDLDRSSDLAEQALSIKVDHLGWDHTSVATTLTTLGNVARMQRNRQLALCYYTKARDIFERVGEGAGAGIAAVLIGMARLHLEYGSAVSARFLLERGLLIREGLMGAPAQCAGVRVLLADVLRETDPYAAEALLGAACREYESDESPRPELLESLNRTRASILQEAGRMARS